MVNHLLLRCFELAHVLLQEQLYTCLKEYSRVLIILVSTQTTLFNELVEALRGYQLPDELYVIILIFERSLLLKFQVAIEIEEIITC